MVEAQLAAQCHFNGGHRYRDRPPLRLRHNDPAIDHRLKHLLAAALHDAVMRDAQGQLIIADTPSLRAFEAENEGLWFVIAASDRSTASYRAVPVAYQGFVASLHLIKDADIRGAPGVTEAASINDIKTISGNMRVMYGGRPNRSLAFLTLLAATYPIYVPLLAVALPAIFLTVPRIVRRALAGLKDVCEKRRRSIRDVRADAFRPRMFQAK